MSYIPNTLSEQEEMLKEIGYKSLEDLYAAVPKDLLSGELKIPSAKSEMEVGSIIASFAEKNTQFKSIFRGAGAYNHHIPAIVTSVMGKEEFVTNYTPYQAEIAQGNLQSIFEYQTMICEITGMDVSNASTYNGAAAAGEAVAMCHERGKRKVLISEAANPMAITTIKTYSFGSNTEVVMIPTKDGITDIDALKNLIDDSTSCVYIEQPNYLGRIEEAKEIADVTHESKAKLIMGINPIPAMLLKTPREYGADIAVGEAQPLGLPLSFGGPYLGFMATTDKMMRRLPGRIVGQTKDIDGKRAFVLTLQAREQHIRREKASSNLCTNQALCALGVGVYMTTMGKQGVKDVANSCYSKAHYMANELVKTGLFKLKYTGEFFHEFLTVSDLDTSKILAKLEENGILGGYPVEDGILWCTTEKNSKKDIDRVIELVKGVA